MGIAQVVATVLAGAVTIVAVGLAVGWSVFVVLIGREHARRAAEHPAQASETARGVDNAA